MGMVRSLIDEYAELTNTPREQLRSLSWREFQRMLQYMSVLRRRRVTVLRRGRTDDGQREFGWLMDKETDQLFEEMAERSRAIQQKLDSWLKTNKKEKL